MRGSIEKRGEFSYRLIVCDDGEYLKRTVKVKSKDEEKKRREAERALALFIEEIEKGKYTKQSGMTLLQYSDYWIKHYAEQALQGKTLSEYKSQLRLRILPALGHLRIQHLKQTHLVEFYSMLSEQSARMDKSFKAKAELLTMLKTKNINGKTLISLSGISTAVNTKINAGTPISKESVERLCKGLKIDEDIAKYFDTIENGNGLSARSIMLYHRLLSSMFNDAVKWGLMAFNPCDKVRPAKERDIDQEIKNFYEIDQIELLRIALANAPFKYRTMIEMLLATGLRIGELVGLKWTDIDYVNQLIYVRKSIQYTPENGVQLKDKLKNKTSKREVALPDYILPLLEEWKTFQDSEIEEWGNEWNDLELIFTSEKGKELYPYTLSNWFPEFLKKNGLDKITPHGMRHTYATLLAGSGEDIKNIQDSLGHAKASTTTDFYLHSSRKTKKKTAVKLDSLLGHKQELTEQSTVV